MVEANKRVREYNAKTEEYLRCLQGTVDQASVGVDEATRRRLADERQAAHNAAVDTLVGWTNCFNEELRRFKESGGGQHGGTVDCSKHLQAAKAGAASNASTAGKVPVTEKAGKSMRLSDGSQWRSTLRGGGDLYPCPFDKGRGCTINAVSIDNPSSRILECSASLWYPLRNGQTQVHVERKGVLVARSERALIRDASLPAEPPSEFDVICLERAPKPAPTTSRTCTFQVVRSVSLSDYYPLSSRQAEEEGPVIVEFTIPGREAPPADVTVAESSLFPELDAAAIKAVQDMSMSTECPNQRFRFLLTFALSY